MIYLLVEDSYFYNQNNDYELLRKKIAFSNKDLAIYLDNLQAEKKLKVVVAFDKKDVKKIFKKNADKKAKEWKMRTMQLTIKIF